MAKDSELNVSKNVYIGPVLKENLEELQTMGAKVELINALNLHERENADALAYVGFPGIHWARPGSLSQ